MLRMWVNIFLLLEKDEEYWKVFQVLFSFTLGRFAKKKGIFKALFCQSNEVVTNLIFVNSISSEFIRYTPRRAEHTKENILSLNIDQKSDYWNWVFPRSLSWSYFSIYLSPFANFFSFANAFTSSCVCSEFFFLLKGIPIHQAFAAKMFL